MLVVVTLTAAGSPDRTMCMLGPVHPSRHGALSRVMPARCGYRWLPTRTSRPPPVFCCDGRPGLRRVHRETLGAPERRNVLRVRPRRDSLSAHVRAF